MQQQTWKAKRNQLYTLIKKVSDQYGGDDPAFLRDYAGDIVFDHSENLDVPIRCFQSLLY